VVHHAAQAVDLRRGKIHYVTVSIVAVALLAGCGGGEPEAPEVPGDSSALQVTAREADCADWNEATADERGTLIDSLEQVEGAPTTGGTPAVLSDEQAYNLFESYCSQSFARAFKLYKLYARAAAFQAPQ
jgi:hypothetical protein